MQSRLLSPSFVGVLFLFQFIIICSAFAQVQSPKTLHASKLEASNQLPKIGIRNPAAAYCEQFGYFYEVKKSDQGESGICRFDDGSSCDGWAFLEGRCGKEFNYCAHHGLGTVVAQDGKNEYTKSYAVCTMNEQPIQSATVLSNLGSQVAVSSRSLEQELNALAQKSSINFEAPIKIVAPDSTMPIGFDWRAHNGQNYLNPVRDQGMCGSCTAFSTISALENTYNIRVSNRVAGINLSEQFLVASGFNTPTGSGVSCCGGWNDSNMANIVAWGGVPEESCLPYVDGGSCNCGTTCNSANCAFHSGGYCSNTSPASACSDAAKRRVSISNWGLITGSSPTQTIANVQNAISAGYIVAAYMGMSSEYGGYFDSSDIYRCTNSSGINHAVTIVGFNDVGWIVRNSWGASWNDHGYFVVGFGECSMSNFYYIQPATSTNVRNCGDVITANTDLITDLASCDSGIQIIAPFVTLDCHGHKITGNGIGTGTGIKISAPLVTVKNCDVSDFQIGIDSITMPQTTLLNNNVHSNINGIKLGTLYHTAKNNSVKSNYQSGISIATNQASTISNNIACGNRVDFSCDVSAAPFVSSGNQFGVVSGPCTSGYSQITCSEKPNPPSKWPWARLTLLDASDIAIAIGVNINSYGPPSTFEVRYSTQDPANGSMSDLSPWWTQASPISLTGGATPGAQLIGTIPGINSGATYHVILRQVDPLGLANFDEHLVLGPPYNKLRNSSFELDNGTDFFPTFTLDDKLANNRVPDGWATSNAVITTSYESTGSNSLQLSNSLVPQKRAFAYQDIPIQFLHAYRISGHVTVDTGAPFLFGTILSSCLDASHQLVSGVCGLNIKATDIIKVKANAIAPSSSDISFDVIANNPIGSMLRVGCYNTPSITNELYFYGNVWCDGLSVVDLGSTVVSSPS